MAVDLQSWNGAVDSRIEKIIADSTATAPAFPSLAVTASAETLTEELERLKANMSNLTEAFRKLNFFGEVIPSDFVIDEEEDFF
jgi:hypothetical protein